MSSIKHFIKPFCTFLRTGKSRPLLGNDYGLTGMWCVSSQSSSVVSPRISLPTNGTGQLTTTKHSSMRYYGKKQMNGGFVDINLIMLLELIM